MGIRDFFGSRRKSEDALAAAREEAGAAPTSPVQDMAAPAPPITGAHGEQIGAPPSAAGGFSVQGLENMGALGPMIQQAIDSGHAQVYQAPPQVLNMTGGDSGEARQEILDVLA